MKKKIVLILAVTVMFAMSACGGGGASTYKKAAEAIENGNYEDAIELLNSIPDYDDSDNLRKQANVGIFNAIVSASTSPECCEVASDGSYIKIDTNPNNTKSFYNAEYTQTVQDINQALGFSDSLWEKMAQTRALDGRQSFESDEFTVTWSYHPDNGLNALYERK